MAALIAMAVHSLEGTDRPEYTKRTITSLLETVDLTKHRLIISDNGSCEEIQEFYKTLPNFVSAGRKGLGIIYNGSNIGTANAINKAWQFRLPNESAIKMDDDVIVHQKNWVEELEEAVARCPKIGICCLKRKDLWEHPDHPDVWWRSRLKMLPHQAGQRWIVAEFVNHAMGTVQLYSSLLLEKFGYLVQPTIYGFDDALSAVRCRLAGFESCFLPHIEIDHIDTGTNQYAQWKRDKATEDSPKYEELKRQYESGALSYYHNPFSA